MKKTISLLLVLAMALSLAACAPAGNNETTAPSETTPAETTAPVVAGPATAQEAMDTIWNAWNFEYKDYFMGGGYNNSVNGMPGAIEASDTESLQYLLYVPEANLADVQSAASVMAMNANTFTAAAFLVSDASAFAATMKDNLMSVQWICGIPESLIVYTLGNNCVLYAFGSADNVSAYDAALTTAYADAVSVFNGNMG